ncbi:HAMP domain-containing histidine kinase [Shewanella eurypsychrophilus]|uniref:histidine kinase n=1 Tax=Shewanella eurypsychrophilus TaxID=2593656 RepID=A0ABX6VBT1_9GAMM|nr:MULTISPECIES: HAMP domain-containing sensor histidine kinase [Shewanella]QFU23776.1 HAMP domain-containing protein [Shewanella sp. YLB-09]QPG58999.1 HAMP domain-containing histidine kinase [Shewanella eurypsychrophilus]
MKLRNSLSALLLGGSCLILMVLVLSYTLWARENYFRALDTSFSINILKAQELINERGFDAVEPSLEIIDARLFHQYDLLPKSVQLQYPQSSLKVGRHHYAPGITDEDEINQRNYFVYTSRYNHEGVYYLVQEYEESDEPSYWDLADSQLQEIWIVSLIVTLFLALLIFGIFHYLTKPLYRLNAWSKQLSSDDLDKPVPSFDYRELDLLAEQFLNSLREVDATTQRETQFLQYASHELRTPIAVVKSNAELLEQLWQDAPKSSLPALHRLTRAGKTMHHLTETLLWLTRKEVSEPISTHFRLDLLIHELIEEHSYLLKGKVVVLNLELAEVATFQSETLVRILIANLIRNAMQHIDEGSISVTLIKQQLTIENRDLVDGGMNQQQEVLDSFGLGLKLVSQISQQQSWQFEVESEPNRYIAMINFLPSKIDSYN